ncbi:hypothetical protein FB451DRAFT_1301109 [Mycena latifolia]|nr:hypothetical protein FB451DRAFT_1301109 [Mycena latifolia]
MIPMPSLWSSIFIAIPCLTSAWTNYPVGLLKAQINRAGSDPLRVVFISKELPGYTTGTLYRELFQCSDRWETLELESATRLPIHFPLLREFRVCVGSNLSQLARSSLLPPDCRLPSLSNQATTPTLATTQINGF